jgi:hypothetical protein
MNFMPGLLQYRETFFETCWIGCRMGPTVGLNDMKGGLIFVLSGHDIKPTVFRSVTSGCTVCSNPFLKIISRLEEMNLSFY